MRHIKGNRGFSLVELIIVMAILVALVAVIAPAYLKYVKRSNDTVLSNCAEEILHAASGEYAVGHLTGQGQIVIKKSSAGQLDILMNKNADGSDKADSGLVYENPDSDETFPDVLGIDQSREIKSEKIFIIMITSKDGAPYIANPEDAQIEMVTQDGEGD